MKECPKCKLINPDSSIRCDCGYSFVDRKMTQHKLAKSASAKLENVSKQNSLNSNSIESATNIASDDNKTQKSQNINGGGGSDSGGDRMTGRRIYCKNCGKEIDELYKECKYCGHYTWISNTVTKKVYFPNGKDWGEISKSKGKEKYFALVVISEYFKLLAWLSLILSVLVLLYVLSLQEFPGGYKLFVFIAALSVGGWLFLINMAISQIIRLFLDIEVNTRKENK